MNPGSSSRSQSHSLRTKVRELKTEAILAAAEEVFASEGIHQARMDAIAARAGMAVGTLYNFFKDRSALVDALVDARSTKLSDELEATLDAAPGAPFEKQVQHFFDAALAHVEKHGRFWVELLRTPGADRRKGRGSETRERLFSIAQRVIDAGVAEKFVKAEAASLYASLLVGSVRSVLEHSAAGRPCITARPGTPAPSTAALLTEFFLRGALR
jgi:AcrR family transcriptional regulator